MQSSTTRTSNSEYRFIEPGIIEQRLLPDVKQTVAGARRNLQVFIELAGSAGAGCLVDLRDGGPAEPGVNDVYASPEIARHTHALALLTGSTVSQLVGNLFLALKHPPMPTRIFGAREEALRWLRQHRK